MPTEDNILILKERKYMLANLLYYLQQISLGNGFTEERQSRDEPDGRRVRRSDTIRGVRRVLPDGLARMTLLEYLRGAYNYMIYDASLHDPFTLIPFGLWY